MTAKNTGSGDRYERSGEQAAKLVGQFVSMANHFGQSFKQSMNATSSGADQAAGDDDNLQRAGRYVRKMRAAAGFSVDDFAQAMGIELAQARSKIEDAENGLAPLPREWLAKAADALRVEDPLDFYSHFNGCYPEPEPAAVPRAQQLAALFDDSTLDDLSPEQFDALLDAMRQSYQSARQLLRR